ncbi:MAG: DUF3137 domain-containing protein [Pirellulaceae bacterium]|nr:DUF3137 domain-containing protein [Pirellulaceae bacterium]
MSALDDILKAIPVQGLLQLVYFWLKNRKRAKRYRKWAKANGLQFALTGQSFQAPPNPATVDQSELHGEKPLSSQQRMFAKRFGRSKIQSQYGQFISNRFRGDWQSDKNICWGSWKGYTVVSWDTVFYDYVVATGQDFDWSEGEFSSILILTDMPLHRTLITPKKLWKRLASFGIEEGSSLTLKNVKFELDSFNKQYQVKSNDPKWAFAIIDQAMMEQLMEHGLQHGIEINSGGIMVSTWFTMEPEEVQKQLDACVDLLGNIPEDLKHNTTD